MTFTRGNAAEMGRKGGKATYERHGTEHMRAIGRKGFDALAAKLGYMGGARRGALRQLLRAGRLADRGPDPTEALTWADRVLEDLDPTNPEVPYR